MNDTRLVNVIEAAIRREENAYDFYHDLAQKAADEDTRETILWIAKEEKKHKAWLVAYKEGGYGTDRMQMTDVTYYKIAEYQEEPPIEENMSSADVYLVASHRELKSYHFYTELAHLHTAGETREILLKMANQELKHKEKMEYLYSNAAFPQTSGG